MAKIKKKSALQKKKDDPNSSLWRNKADKLWRTVVFHMYKGKCAICGSTDSPQAHHLIPRQMGSHRHIPLNGIMLCSSHHKYSFTLSPHKAPIEFSKWMIANQSSLWQWLLSQTPTRQSSITFQERANILGGMRINKEEELWDVDVVVNQKQADQQSN